MDWDEPLAEHQNGIIREYHINFTESETGKTFFEVVTTDSATISSLHPNYNYYINVTAVTVLPGPTSPAIVVMTPEDGTYNRWCSVHINADRHYMHVSFNINPVPSGYPQGMSTTTISTTSATLSWSELPQEQQNGVIIGYVISVVVLEDNSTFSLSSTSTNVTLTTLKPYRTYICIVAAQTAVGTGPFGTQLSFVTLEAGKAVCMNKTKATIVTQQQQGSLGLGHTMQF